MLREFIYPNYSGVCLLQILSEVSRYIKFRDFCGLAETFLTLPDRLNQELVVVEAKDMLAKEVNRYVWKK